MTNFIKLMFIVILSGCDSNPPVYNLTNNCDVVVGCPIDDMSEQLTLSVPKIISPEQLFSLELAFSNSVSNIEAKLEGITMYMGVIPVLFKQQGDSSQYRATTLVGRCATDTMQWRLTLQWQQGSEQFKAFKLINIKQF